MTRRTFWVLGLLAVVIAGAYVGGARRTEGPPLDPSSTAPDGAKAVVELTEALGGDIDLIDGAPGADFEVALLLEDRLSRADAADLSAWVREGGVLVVADPSSLFTPPVRGAATDRVGGGCGAAGLERVEVLDVDTARTYEVPPGATGCFGSEGEGSFLVLESEGAGSVVSLGGPDAFTNRRLGQADNAGLAAALLVRPGGTAFVRPSLPGGGERGLVDLVGTPVRAALAQLLVAFAVVVAWRARRLGRPVEEPQPVRIEGSELTRAVGRLLGGNRRPDRAAAILRDRARRDLSGPLGLPLDADVDAVVSSVTARTTLSETEVRRAVAGPVRTDDDLVDAARTLTRIREETTHDRSAALRP